MIPAGFPVTAAPLIILGVILLDPCLAAGLRPDPGLSKDGQK
ncbi:MAG TPA: hypothetical protein VF983_02620 [Streptosporangiaceae bacterium]